MTPPRATSLDFFCPTCSSLVGEPCVRLDNYAPTSPHPRRRALAAEENAARFPQHVTGQRPLW